jgi:hypothetical protein
MIGASLTHPEPHPAMTSRAAPTQATRSPAPCSGLMQDIYTDTRPTEPYAVTPAPTARGSRCAMIAPPFKCGSPTRNGHAPLRPALQAHYNTARPHQSIAQHVPDSDPDIPRATVTDIDTQQIPQRPDHARRLTHGRPAAHQPNPIFERDRFESVPRAVKPGPAPGSLRTSSCPRRQAASPHVRAHTARPPAGDQLRRCST